LLFAFFFFTFRECRGSGEFGVAEEFEEGQWEEWVVVFVVVVAL
jgi:hypothetical protein